MFERWESTKVNKLERQNSGEWAKCTNLAYIWTLLNPRFKCGTFGGPDFLSREKKKKKSASQEIVISYIYEGLRVGCE